MELELSPEVEELIKAMLGELNDIKEQLILLNAQIDTMKFPVVHQIPSNVESGFENQLQFLDEFATRLDRVLGAILKKIK